MKGHDKIQGKLDALIADDMAYIAKDSIFFKEGKKGHVLLIYNLDVELVEAAEKTVYVWELNSRIIYLKKKEALIYFSFNMKLVATKNRLRPRTQPLFTNLRLIQFSIYRL